MANLKASSILALTLALFGVCGAARATPAPPIELHPVVKCQAGLARLPRPEQGCLGKEVIVGDLDISGPMRQNIRDNTGDLVILLMDTGLARFSAFARSHAGSRFSVLIGGRVIATLPMPEKTPTEQIPLPGLPAAEAEEILAQSNAQTNVEFCDRHAASTDDFTQRFCSGYKSQADLSLPAPVINAATLRAARSLEGDALKFDCALPTRFTTDPFFSSMPADKQKSSMRRACDGLFGPGPDGLLAPLDARNVKLAIRAAFRPSFHMPASEIHIAISSTDEGTYLLAQQDGNWQTRGGSLTKADIGVILAALERSHLWQQPFNHDVGMLDGEPDLFEAAFGDWRITATQNGYEGVDLDILKRALLTVAKAHNSDRPLSWFR